MNRLVYPVPEERFLRDARARMPDVRFVPGCVGATYQVRDGEVTHYRCGRALTVAPAHEAAIARRMNDYYADRYGFPAHVMAVPATPIGRIRKTSSQISISRVSMAS